MAARTIGAPLSALLISAFLTLAVNAPAQATGFPLIISATVDYTHKTLTITGQNFGSSPTITLDSLTFPTLSSASSQIVGNFPSGSPPSSFTPGTYFLTLQFRNQLPAVFAVAIGANGASLPSCTAPDVAVLYNGAFVCKSAVPHYVDNGDGTVTDNRTGLMWEKKDGTCAVAGPHCWNNTYTWTATGTAPDGTLYTNFLATLNLNSSSDGTAVCFANHCDWRIPTVVELRSILFVQFPTVCTSIPCIDPIFGPTQPTFYWSSSSDAGFSGAAWDVIFDSTASVNANNEPNAFYARAVRGGQ